MSKRNGTFLRSTTKQRPFAFAYLSLLSASFGRRISFQHVLVFEQFAGVGVDIRSDLYSLGVTLWVMVTGQTPFRGPSAEVMYQHQHAPLPLEQLKGIPQPVVVLLEKLLEKDPAQRFQTPNDLLKAIPRITDAIDGRRRITRKNLQQIPHRTSHTGTAKPPARL